MKQIKRRKLQSIIVSINEAHQLEETQNNLIEPPKKVNADPRLIATLDMLEFDKMETAINYNFEEKIQKELELPKKLITVIFQKLKMDTKILHLFLKLFDEKENYSSKDLMFQINNLTLSSNQQIKKISKSFFFYQQIKERHRQFVYILREFKNKKIQSLIEEINLKEMDLVKSKILTVISMINFKYCNICKQIKCLKLCIDTRRKIEKREGQLYQSMQIVIDEDYFRTTLFFTIKYLQILLKDQNTQPYDVLMQINQFISISSYYKVAFKIQEQIFNVYQEEIQIIKQEAYKKLKDNYFLKDRPQEKLLVQNEKKKSQSLLTSQKQTLRKQSSNYLIKKQTNRKQLKTHSLPSSKQKINANIKNRYLGPDKRKISNFTDQGSKSLSNLRKSQKKQSISFEINQSIQKNRLFSNAKEQNLGKKAISASLVRHETSLKVLGTSQKDVSNNLLIRFGNFCHLATSNPLQTIVQQELRSTKNNATFKSTKKLQKKKINQKKEKIKDIYKKFSNMNNLIKEIPQSRITSQIGNLQFLKTSNKNMTRKILYDPILNFSAGLSGSSNLLSNMIQNINQSEINFIKIWMDNLYVCKISLEIQISKKDKSKDFKVFILNCQVNNIFKKIILHQGANMLLERYLTIWPTIRYLISKKLTQFDLLKNYQSLIKKKEGDNLSNLDEDFYIQLFKIIISKEQVQEIDICLDSIFKLQFIAQYYSSKKEQQNLLQKVLSNQEHYDGVVMKKKLLQQIYKSSFYEIVISKFFYMNHYGIVLIEVRSNLENLQQAINYPSVPLSLKINAFCMKTMNEDILNLRMNIKEFQQENIFAHNLKQYYETIGNPLKGNHSFNKRIFNFFHSYITVKINSFISIKIQWEKDKNIKFHSQIQNSVQQTLKNKSVKYTEHINFQESFLQTVQQVCDLKKQQKKTKLTKQKQLQKIDYEQIEKIFIKIKNQLLQSKKNHRKFHFENIKLNGNYYTVRLSIIYISIDRKWVAKYKIQDKKFSRYYKFYLNYIDYENLLSSNSFLSDDLQPKGDYNSQVEQKLIQFIKHICFIYTGEIKKICMSMEAKYYCNKLKNKKTLNYGKKMTLSVFENQWLIHKPLNLQIQKQIKEVIFKIIKFGQSYVLIVLKQKIFDQQYVWEFSFNSKIRNCQYSYELSEYEIIQLIRGTNSNKKPWQIHLEKQQNHQIQRYIYSENMYCRDIFINFSKKIKISLKFEGNLCFLYIGDNSPKQMKEKKRLNKLKS